MFKNEDIILNNSDFKIKKTILSIVLFIIIFLFFFTLFEIIVRIYRPQFTYSKFGKIVNSCYAPSVFNRFTLKPNYSGIYPSMEYPGKNVTVTTNSLGLRGKEVTYERNKNLKRILILGDSYTFGVYVDDHETYAAVLQDILGNNGYKVEVINAGYADGFEADEEYVWLINEGLKFSPDIIIYGFFIGNDIILEPQNWHNLDENGLPTKIIDPSLYVDKFDRLRSKGDDNKTVGQQLIYRFPLLRESHLCVLLGLKLETLYNVCVAKLLHKKIAPRGWSVALYPQIFGSDISGRIGKNPTDFEKDFEKNEKLFKKIIFSMDAIAKANNSKFIILMIPFNFQVDPDYFLKIVFKYSDEISELRNGDIGIERDYFKEIEPLLEAQNIRFINMLELMKKNKGRYYPKNGEAHFNPAGHRFVAEQIFNYIKANNLLTKKQ